MTTLPLDNPVVLYKIRLAEGMAVQPETNQRLGALASFASSALALARLALILLAIMTGVIAGGTIGVQAGVILGLLAMIGATLALGGLGLFALSVTELFVWRGFARRVSA